jgi:uncharacterized LabA/DUF88 family protein
LAETRLKIAVFIDFDNIEIGVKTTLGQHFDVGAVLEAIKERGEVVTKVAYGDWTRAGDYSRSLTQHAIHMVQRNLTPGGDKNGADINLALDALEMAFTHNHINAFVIVGGDSDFMALVEKLKQYDRKVFVVGGRAFTSIILQKNCTEFIAYENLVNLTGATPPKAGGRGGKRAEAPVAQAVALVRRALKVLSDREVSPQLGVLKSTLLQLDSTFSEREYGASTFRDFVQRLARAGYVTLKGTDRNIYVELREGTDGNPASGGQNLPASSGGKDSDAAAADGADGSTAAIDGEALPLGGDATPAGHIGHTENVSNTGFTGSAGTNRGTPASSAAGAFTAAAGGAPNGAASTHASGVASPDAAVTDGVGTGTVSAASGTSPQIEGARFITDVFQRPGIVSRWPLYLRQVKQILRSVDESFDERRYGFQGLVEALRYCQREGLFRLDRDRQGVLRVYPGPALSRTASATGHGADPGGSHAQQVSGDEPLASATPAARQEHERDSASGNLFGSPTGRDDAGSTGAADEFATVQSFGTLAAGEAAADGAEERESRAASAATDASLTGASDGEASASTATTDAARPGRGSRRRRPGATAAKSAAKKTAATPKPRGVKSSRPRKTAKEKEAKE